jgi:hypothetical protein
LKNKYLLSSDDLLRLPLPPPCVACSGSGGGDGGGKVCCPVQQLERNMMPESLSSSSNWNQKFKLTVEIKRREELNY